MTDERMPPEPKQDAPYPVCGEPMRCVEWMHEPVMMYANGRHIGHMPGPMRYSWQCLCGWDVTATWEPR